MSIESDTIKAIWTNTHREKIEEKSTKYIIADIARFGSDKAVLSVWQGLMVIDLVIFDKSSTTDIQNAINTLRTKHNIPANKTLADEDGVGDGVVDACGIEGFVNNGKPGNPNYQNLKTECGYKLAELIKDIYVKVDVAEDTKTRIENELAQLKTYDADKDNKLRILPKEKIKANIGHSPDFLDVFIMRMYFEINPNKGEYYIY